MHDQDLSSTQVSVHQGLSQLFLEQDSVASNLDRDRDCLIFWFNVCLSPSSLAFKFSSQYSFSFGFGLGSIYGSFFKSQIFPLVLATGPIVGLCEYGGKRRPSQIFCSILAYMNNFESPYLHIKTILVSQFCNFRKESPH